MSPLEQLYAGYFGEQPHTTTELTASGSNRRYYRLISENHVAIGVDGTSVEENKAFITMAGHFRSKQLPVPQIFAQSIDNQYYLQEDLGNTLLFDYIADGRKTGVFFGTRKGNAP